MNELDSRRLEELCDNVEDIALQQSAFNGALVALLVMQGIIDKDELDELKAVLVSIYDQKLAALKDAAMYSDTPQGEWLRKRAAYDKALTEFYGSLESCDGE